MIAGGNAGALTACGGVQHTAAAASGPVRLAGSDTMRKLAQAWAERFTVLHRGWEVRVSGGGTSGGLAALETGVADVCLASRRASEAERRRISSSLGTDVRESIVGIDAIGIYAHSRCGVESAPLTEFRRLFEGEIKNWRELGGADVAVRLFGRDEASGTHVMFQEMVLKGRAFAQSVRALPDTDAVMRAVAETEGGVGYGGLTARGNVVALAVRGPQGSARPESRSVRDGAYPLARPLFLYSPSKGSDGVSEFVAWATGAEAQAVVERSGFVSVGVG